jgi:hypothetical protein
MTGMQTVAEGVASYISGKRGQSGNFPVSDLERDGLAREATFILVKTE